MANKRRGNSSRGGGPSLVSRMAAQGLVLLGLLTLMFYMWGRVRIDTVVRERSRLEKEQALLVSEINALRVEVNAMKSYSQISRKAKEQGLGVIPVARRSELSVDMEAVPMVLPRKNQYRVAGMGLWNR